MLFSTKWNRGQYDTVLQSLVLYLNGARLSFVSVYRYLRVDLENHPAMDTHVERISGLVKSLLYSLAKLRYYVNQDTSILMYKTYILPVLNLDCILWMNLSL